MKDFILTVSVAFSLIVGTLSFYVMATDPENLTPRDIACETEDTIPADFPCYWDADERGNGEGRSFTAYPDGRVIYDAR